jgi:hypothetical protein
MGDVLLSSSKWLSNTIGDAKIWRTEEYDLVRSRSTSFEQQDEESSLDGEKEPLQSNLMRRGGSHREIFERFTSSRLRSKSVISILAQKQTKHMNFTETIGIALFLTSILCLALYASLKGDVDLVSDNGILRNKGKMLLYPNRAYRDEYKNVKLLIPATKPNANFCRTLFSALVNGYPAPHLINHHLRVINDSQAHFAKIQGYTTYFKEQVEEKDVILFVDGYDVTFQLSLDVLMKRYEKQSSPTIFAADKSCWPYVKDSHFCDVPQSTLPAGIYGAFEGLYTVNPRFLNSGCAIGQAKSMSTFFDHVEQIAESGAMGRFSDQAVIAEAFSSGRHEVTLDYESRLFQTLIHSWDDVDWSMNPDPHLPPYWNAPVDVLGRRSLDLSELDLDTPKKQGKSPWKDRRLARNIRSNTIPALLHHNLHKELIAIWFSSYLWFGKLPLRKLLQTMLIEQKGPRAGAGAWDGSTWIDYSDLCGSYDLFETPSVPSKKIDHNM